MAITEGDARLREAMCIEDGIFLHSRGVTYSGTTAAGRFLLFLSGAAWQLVVSPICFERAECRFLPSVKTKPAKSMWLITRVAYTVLVLLQCLIVRRMLQTVPLNLGCVL